jgi:hypothetical protein
MVECVTYLRPQMDVMAATVWAEFSCTVRNPFRKYIGAEDQVEFCLEKK